MTLTQDTIERFRRDGYLEVEGMLAPDRLEMLREEAHAVLKDPAVKRSSAADYLQDQYATQWGVFSEHLWLDEERLGGSILFVRENPAAREVASALLGEPARATKVSMQVMYPRCGCKQPWHQDHTPNDPKLWWINCMYYLDDMSAANGSLMVIPGSHRTVLNARMQDYGLVPGAVRLTPRAGSAVFFYGQILHAADEHRGERPRLGIKTHYSVPHIDPLAARHEQRYSRGVRRGNMPPLDHDNGKDSYWFA
ncbi:MAG: phytanoyl-CoA dioxygenase family protein [Planctomycetota bacterium]|nr:phytanoyl-CoA dioxygenase family protein [Planctomycetota bacterium]